MKDNIKMVLTVDNTEHPLVKCLEIEGKYFLKGKVSEKDSGHVYRINNSWTAHAVWDHYKKKYVSPIDENGKSCLITGVVGKNYELGNFDKHSPHIFISGALAFLNKEVAKENGIDTENVFRTIEMDEKGVYKMASIEGSRHLTSGYKSPEHNLLFTLSDIKIVGRPFSSNPNYIKKYYANLGISTCNTYSLADVDPIFKKYMLAEYSSSFVEKPLVFQNLSKMIPYSVGIEFETNKGAIPAESCQSCGLFPLRDGSITGMEYVSLPYSGDKLIDSVVKSCLALVNYTTADHSCSLHVHFGGLPKDRLFILSLYKLWHDLEEEMNCLNIINKRNFKFINAKKSPEKDHCQPLPDLNFPKIMNKENVSKMYGKLISLLNNGRRPDREFNPKSKNTVYAGQQKWNVNGRYFTLNVMNYLYGNGTVEFRLHKGTVNPYKVVNYIMILNAIVNYCMTRPSRIFDIYSRVSLKDVLYNTYKGTPLFEYLYEYVQERKNSYFDEYVVNANSQHNRYQFASSDFIYDNVYTFKSNGFDILQNDSLNYLKELGPFEKPLPLTDQSRFPFVYIESPEEDVSEESFDSISKFLSEMFRNLVKYYQERGIDPHPAEYIFEKFIKTPFVEGMYEGVCPKIALESASDEFISKEASILFNIIKNNTLAYLGSEFILGEMNDNGFKVNWEPPHENHVYEWGADEDWDEDLDGEEELEEEELEE